MYLDPLFNRCAYKSSTPLALVSAPGQGKTQMVEAWCKRNNRTLVKLLASSLDETDVAGVIVPKDGHAVTLSPQWLPQLGNNGVLFLDECNCARKEVQDTLLTLVQSRHMPNGDRIPDGVMIIAAMNPSEMCDNYEMSPAMKTRFMWCHLRTSFNQTIQWLTCEDELFTDIPAPSTYQTFGEWHERFRKDKSFEPDKKALLQELSKLGFDYTSDEEFADEELGACARNFCNLMYWTQNALEVLQWASAFVSDKATEVIRTVNVASFRTTGNQVFGNRRTLTDVNEAENENINNRQNVMNNIMNEVGRV